MELDCNCGNIAQYCYRGENYCDECLLEALEENYEITSYEVTYKQYFFISGDYIGDDHEDAYDVIDCCLEYIPDLKEVD